MSDEQQSGVCSESSDYKLAKAAARPGAIVKLPPGTSDAIRAASDQYLKGFVQIQDSVRVITEQFTKNLEGLFSLAAQISSQLSSYFGVLDELRESVCSNLEPLMRQLAEIGASLDWEAILEDSRRWGLVWLGNHERPVHLQLPAALPLDAGGGRCPLPLIPRC